MRPIYPIYPIYLDYNAATPVAPEAAATATVQLRQLYRPYQFARADHLVERLHPGTGPTVIFLPPGVRGVEGPAVACAAVKMTCGLQLGDAGSLECLS